MYLKNRMRQSRTSGSVGDLGGQPPRSTRPISRRVWSKILYHSRHRCKRFLSSRPLSTVARRQQSGIRNRLWAWPITVAIACQAARFSARSLWPIDTPLCSWHLLISCAPRSATCSANSPFKARPSWCDLSTGIRYGDFLLKPTLARAAGKRSSATFTSAVRHRGIPLTRTAKGEYCLWQRRYWEHTLGDESDRQRHVDYIHYNPVKHGLVKRVCLCAGPFPFPSDAAPALSSRRLQIQL